MIKNYLKTGFRNLLRNKRFALINIFGLAVGVASCLLISLFVKDELTFDNWHSNGDNIYRITTISERQGEESTILAVGYPVAEAFANEIPEIQAFARLRKEGATVKSGNNYIDEKSLVYTDHDLFKIFDFEVVDGALDERMSDLEYIVITESTAIKYFGSTQVAGESLTIKLRDHFEDFVVVSVIKDHPSNSTFNFSMAISWSKFKTIMDDFSLNMWSITPANAYVLLNPEANLDSVLRKMAASRALHNEGEESFKAFAREQENGLLPLSDLHFFDGYGGADINQVYILSSIAMLILIIACFNFANLSLVNSMSRYKEVGVRKTIGASKKHLVTQFLIEACIICVIAFVLGVIIAEVSLPTFEGFMQKDFNRNLLHEVDLLLVCLAGVVGASMVSIIYPSLFLSAIKVSNVLKGFTGSGGKKWLTKAIVGFQFLLALVLITVTVTLNKQHHFLINKDKGYNDQNLIRLEIPNDDTEAMAKRIGNSLSQSPNIVAIGASSSMNEAISLKRADGSNLLVIQSDIDEGYIETLGIELLEGRNITEADKIDIEEERLTSNVLINKATVKALGIVDPVGKIIGDGAFRIVGVIDDYQLFSATSPMNSVMLMANNWPRATANTNQIYLRYKPSKLSEVISSVEKVWKEVLPYEPINMTFVDEYNSNLYTKEARWSKTLNYASILAISVSLVGLFGLVGLSVNKRKKEVSVRKVLGASVANLLLLLNQGFTKILLLSALISIPVAYYVISEILQGYINRIDITPMLLILPLLATIVVAWLTVSSITLQSAHANPVDSLRDE
tara:strand:- start:128 stop:2509 length:2382 start_codon:yes stop_codon:yes gene_type:complete